MQFFTNPASPFCRKVEVILTETGQRDDVEFVAATGNPLDSPQLVAQKNPMGKIPVLVREGGEPIYDSRVICRYLDDRANSGLYAADKQWEILTLEATGDGICDAAVLMVYEGRTRPVEKHHAPWIEGQWAKIERSLDALGSHWMPLLRGRLNAGQISVACALGYLDFRHGDREWRKGRRELAAWF